ncbi:hypothetical protein Tsubulata_013497, partial [Turnera subulata]
MSSLKNVHENYSDDDDYNYNDGALLYYSSNGSDDDYVDEADESQVEEKNYTILRESDIRQLMEADIAALATTVSITKQEASILLRYYNWRVTNVYEAWVADESGVRKKVGLLSLDDTVISNDNGGDRDPITCGICFDTHDLGSTKSAACGHRFCEECWGQYVHAAVDGSAGCLTLKCPQPKCGVAVGEDVIDAVALEEDKKKYYHYLVRSYVEDNKTRKWCPAPDCDCAVDFEAGDDSFDVTCLCSHTFCWNCCEEKHRPIDCATVTKWNLKNSSESENLTWKKAYTKSCPKCNRSIEKWEGCMHMTCGEPCKYQFCWLCLGDWKEHRVRGCNSYVMLEQEKEADALKNDLLRYQHYFDRWAANEKSRQIAFGDLQKVLDTSSANTAGCSVITGLAQPGSSELNFLAEAWKQIVECRRVLKWTYAYGYYLSDIQVTKKEFFEYLQGQAEMSLERLHDCAEKEIPASIETGEREEFYEVKQKLITLTKAAKTFFENLVRALENGLADVTSQARSSLDEEAKDRPSKYTRITRYGTAGDRRVPPRAYLPPAAALRQNLLLQARNATLPVQHNTPQGTTTSLPVQHNTPQATTTSLPAQLNTPQGIWSCEFCAHPNPQSAEYCEEDKKKYYHYLVRSYVEDNKTRKWCPAPDCDCAVDFEAGDDSFDVTCLCSHTFCWNCCEEKHRPIDCDTKAYTKSCPKCNRSIEKAEGCMHMTCGEPCGYEFCWLCRGDWEKHDNRGCNSYTGRKGEEKANNGLADVTAQARSSMDKEAKDRPSKYTRITSDDHGDFNDDKGFTDEEVHVAEDSLQEKEEDAVDFYTMRQNNYKFLKEADIRQRIEDRIKELSFILCISESEASILLCHYNWSVGNVHDAWFADESGVRTKVGLLENPAPVDRYSITSGSSCGICFDEFPRDKLSSASCGHLFCNTCWSVYVKTSIDNDGLGCLKLRCPDPSCGCALDQEMLDSLLSEEDRKRYRKCLVRSYVENSKKRQWCPGADCEYAVEFAGEDINFDVTCRCFTTFCWSCSQEGHRPVDCETVKKWILKNNAESENVKYIVEYCKPCPNCRKPIEKADGCMMMQCTQCDQLFCWFCLKRWHHTNCNQYRVDDAGEVEKKENAKLSVQKYVHYFERWDANRKSKEKALKDCRGMMEEKFESLSHILGLPEAYFDFITKAWLQVADCRRDLEWSYAYGYYLSDEEKAKKNFFEYLQGDAESGLEKLHQCLERELLDVIGRKDLSLFIFNRYRTKLVGLTNVTANYFEKLSSGLAISVPITIRSLPKHAGCVLAYRIPICLKKRNIIMDYYNNSSDEEGESYFSDNENTNSYQEKEDDDGEVDGVENSLQESEEDKDFYMMRQNNYKFLKEEDIRQRMEDGIKELSTTLCLSKSEASILLRHYNWSVSNVHDAWFADESGVREKVGLLENPATPASNKVEDTHSCGICFDEFPWDKLSSASCGHLYCHPCWSSYVKTSIDNDGLGCLKLRCPEPSCVVAVSQDMLESLVSEEDRKKYTRYLVTSYVEKSKKRKWCPGTGCEYAVEFCGEDINFDVTCRCFTTFCWSCNQEGHRPVDCETVKKWILKNSAESENVKYILAYCKPCPNCRKPIEKNGGCILMYCLKCEHSFCWICLAPTRNHNIMNCNRYDKANVPNPKANVPNPKANVPNPREQEAKYAKRSLEKYTHYFERWDANRRSKEKALQDCQRVTGEKFESFSSRLGLSETYFDFITKAWLPVVDCRRVLEWSYAYGYYLDEDEKAKIQFLEYLQGEALSGLEKLHHCVESELFDVIDNEDLSSVDFAGFRTKVVGLTNVTANYFEK